MTDAATNGVPILETHGLTMRFGGVVAAENVEFHHVRSGELHCMIGPNGAGKSRPCSPCYDGIERAASAGQIFIARPGRDADRHRRFTPTRSRAAASGIKTFQVPTVPSMSLSVRENI